MKTWLLVGALLLIPSPLAARGMVLDAQVRLAWSVHSGRLSPPPPDLVRYVDEVDIAVTVRFDPAPSPVRLAELERQGIRLARQGNQPVHVGPIYSMRVPFVMLATLSQSVDIRRIELGVPAYKHPPLNWSRTEAGAAGLGEALAERGMLTGQGTLIADLDTGIDANHPDFFRPDGGNYRWIDVDGDGWFTDGIDVVDLNEDGEAGEGESLTLLESTTFAFDNAPMTWADGDLDVGTDWLFVDEDGSDSWSHGGELGYTDDDPAFGEPIFMVEDLDEDGRLGWDERLMRLGSSRVLGVLGGDGTPWATGEISLAEVDSNGHGTQVMSIAAGGYHQYRRFVGMAPGAEVVSANVFSEHPYVEAMAWAASWSPDVMLHEIGMWHGQFLDGSSNIEQALTTYHDQGIVQVCPAGNIGDNYRHGTADIKSSTSYIGPFFLYYPPELAAWGSQAWYLTVQARADLTKVTPLFDRPQSSGQPGAGDFITIPVSDVESCKSDTMGNTTCAIRDVSDAGTEMWVFVMYRWTGTSYAPPTTGYWSLWFKNRNSSQVRLQLWTADDKTSWGGGASFVGPPSLGSGFVGNIMGSVTSPAVASACVTVGSYSTREDSLADDYTPGSFDLSGFSGRGPRLDGVPLLDVAAPGHYDVISSRTGGWGDEGAYAVFGGTSAAGPHVAGVVAQLRQAFPALSPAEIGLALAGAASLDTYTGTNLPDEEWGGGKLAALATRNYLDEASPTFDVRVWRDPILPGVVWLVIDPSESLLAAPVVLVGDTLSTVNPGPTSAWQLRLDPAPPSGETVQVEITGKDLSGNATTQALSVTF